MSFLETLQASPIAEWVRDSDYGYYIVLAGHAVGMGVVAGAMLMLALRVYGFARTSSILIFDRLFSIAWLGFVLNAITGVVLFTSNAERLVTNAAFLIKLGLIVVGGFAGWALWRAVQAELTEFEAAGVGSSRLKALAALTALLWTAAIVAGRIIGYTIRYS